MIELDLEVNYPHVFSTTVYQSNQYVFEYYRSGYKSKARNTRSITKSVLSTLYGIAIECGYLKSLDEPFAQYLPEYSEFCVDKNTSRITFRHLLSMTSGLECSDRRPLDYFKSANWTKYYLERKVTHKPGTKFRYSSASSNLLAILLCKLTSLGVHEFAKQYLFTPLGISKNAWATDNQGYSCGGFGLDLTPNDITQFGLLYLNKGVTDKKRLLSENYVAEATKIQSSGGLPEKDAYGLHWWVGQYQGLGYFYAAGFGGQYVFIVPDLELIVTITSDSRRAHKENKNIFTKFILPNQRFL